MKEFLLLERLIFDLGKLQRIQEIIIPSSSIIRIWECKFQKNLEYADILEKNMKDKVENASGFSEVKLETSSDTDFVLGKPSDIYKQML